MKYQDIKIFAVEGSSVNGDVNKYLKENSQWLAQDGIRTYPDRIEIYCIREDDRTYDFTKDRVVAGMEESLVQFAVRRMAQEVDVRDATHKEFMWNTSGNRNKQEWDEIQNYKIKARAMADEYDAKINYTKKLLDEVKADKIKLW